MDNPSTAQKAGVAISPANPGKISEWRLASLLRFVANGGRRAPVWPRHHRDRGQNPGQNSECLAPFSRHLPVPAPGKISETIEIPAFPEVPLIPTKIPRAGIAQSFQPLTPPFPEVSPAHSGVFARGEGEVSPDPNGSFRQDRPLSFGVACPPAPTYNPAMAPKLPTSAATARKTPLTLVKATGAVEIKADADLTLADRRLFNHLLAHAYESLGTVESHAIELASIRRFAAEVRDGTADVNNTRLKASIETLQKVLCQFNYLRSDGTAGWESAQLLGPCRIEGGVLTYTFHSWVSERLKEPALYSYLSLRIIYEFESKYALTLYEVLKRYADRNAAEPYWQTKVEELRAILGCVDKLKDWKDLRKYALDPALAEIARLGDFEATLHEIRQGGGRGGGRVVGCVFRIQRKSKQEAEQAVREIAKPKAQRRGERAAQKEEGAFAARVDAALRFLEGAELGKRMEWAKRAEELGMTLPPAATAKDNLRKWVPALAEIVVDEEHLRVRAPVAGRGAKGDAGAAAADPAGAGPD
ncbi:RepB family plasmid replication initiator protein [Niveispirillum sp. SYP-B3756]|nr:RepB family plasmid replication initiator protein [Niveispirillum sp. SYP-B3756]